MSSLSDLLPAGSSGKTLTATASGAVAAKKPVILNSAGTVTEVGESTSSDVIPAGSSTTWNQPQAGNGNYYRANMHRVAWDSGDTNKFISVEDENYDAQIVGRIGTVSNSGGSTSISMGTKVVIATPAPCIKGIAEDPNNAGKWMLHWNDRNTTSNHYAQILNASGSTSFSVGTLPGVTGSNASASQEPGSQHSIAWDPNVENQAVIVYETSDSPALSYAQVVTVSGNSISYGTRVSFGGSSNIIRPVIEADPNTSGVFIVSYRDGGNSNYPVVNSLTLSGTSITFGTAVVAHSAGAAYSECDMAVDPSEAGKFVVMWNAYYTGYADRNYAAKVGTRASDGTITLGSITSPATAISGTAATSGHHSMRAVGGNTKSFAIYLGPVSGSFAQDSLIVKATRDGNTLSFTSVSSDMTNGAHYYSLGGLGLAMDSNNLGRGVMAWTPGSSSGGKPSGVRCFEAGVTTSNVTSTNFLGIADAAISNSASGDVVVRGGTVSEFGGIASATGGTITTDGDYKVHTFTSSGTFEVTSITNNPTVDILQIAGGGGGGRRRGGGGGAGGYLYETGVAVSAASYSVTVGAGGDGSTGGNSSNGGNSSIGSLITVSVGGGGGGGNAHGANGGSGGGGQGMTAGINAGTATSGQGNDGAAGSNLSYGGGGGGSGGAPDEKDGGAGTANSITGSAVTRAGGGGAWNGGDAGSGGASAGGSGSSAASNATANTGSGGGGGGDDANGGNGGSGVVIVRYQFQGDQGSFSAGSKYYVQGDGTLSTTSSSTTAGLAISKSQLLLNGES